MSNIVIDIAAEFTGNKAFKQAETSTDKLTKGVKKLAAAVGLAFSAKAVVNFGRLAVKASLDQQAEQNRLNQLLKVGVGATTQEIALLNDQAKALEKIGVVAGGNITQTQSQLATFNLQVSTIEKLTPAILDYVTAEKGATASTADFKSMTNGLAQALNGNFASLTRVGFVLDENTKKQIKSGTETERAEALVKVLNSTYKDFNKNLRETDAGQMQVLANSAQEATTIIGTGLIDALKAVAKDNSIEELAASMESAALSTADFIRGLGQIGSFELNNETKSFLGLLSTPFKRSFSAGPLGAITRLGAASRAGEAGGFPQGAPSEFQSGINARKEAEAAAAEAKARKLAAAQAAKLAATQKKTLKSQQDALKLAKAKAVFDLQQIQIEAALKGKISKEDEIRLKLMKALEEENLTQVEKYQKALATAQEKTAELQKAVALIGESKASDPFSNWAGYVKTAIDLTNTVAQASLQAGLDAGAKLSQALSGARYAAQAAAAADASSSAAAITGAYGAASEAAAKAAADAAAANSAAIAAANSAALATITSQTKAQQDAAAAQIKAAQDAAAAQTALLTASSAEQKAALETQFKQQQEAIAAQSKAQLEALQAQLKAEAAAFKELADATAAEAEAALLTQANEYTAASLAKIASDAAAQAASAAAASAAAGQASAAATTSSSTNPITITVNTGVGDPNAIAEEIQKVLEDAYQRGSLLRAE
jgi:hypothetical protein